MDEISNYETYLYISPNKFIITVNTSLRKTVYYEELAVNDPSDNKNFEKLDQFLNHNIFKIEKKLKSFVEKIDIIIDLDIFFPVEISIKNNNHEDYIDLKNLNYLLYEAKEVCKKTIDQKKIIHMIINNYQIDNKIYSSLPDNIKCSSYSLDLKLICISNSLIREIEIILKKYHISLNQLLSGSYIKNFFLNDERDIFLMAKKMIDGYNPNEVILKDKSEKNQGFFEKFFHFFS